MFIDDISGGKEVLSAAAVCYTDEGEKNASRAGGLDIYRFGRDFKKTEDLMEFFFGAVKCGTAHREYIGTGGRMRLNAGAGAADYSNNPSQPYSPPQDAAKVEITAADGDIRPSVIVFFSAAGIAVRSIAPFIADKTSDPAVIVVNDRADYVIPILSGHIGRANDAARALSDDLGAEAVITTASDSAGKAEAVDVFAQREGYRISSIEAAKNVTSAIVAGENVKQTRTESGGLILETSGHREAALRLEPKRIVIGLGCRRGTAPAGMRSFVLENLKESGAAPEDVYKICSIDIKADELCMAAAASAVKAPLVVFSADQLNGVPGSFTDSDFVRKTTGTGNVCERAAIAGCGKNGGKIIIRKTARSGMTFAAAERNIL